jgi:proton-dependent oligopeptide transporter, POT family
VTTLAPSIDHPLQTEEQPTPGRHPPGLRLLFFSEMWERFSYYGMRAILVLFLTNALLWSNADAARLYGTYTALVFLTPLIGGYIADRLIGTRASLLIGGSIIALGHFTMAFGPDPIARGAAQPSFAAMLPFYAGLLFIIIGTGFFKPNVSTMVGQLYREGDSRRDAGFTIFYMGINLGAFLGPLVCAYLAESARFGWHWGFAAAGVGMVLGLVQFTLGKDKYLKGIGFAPDHAARRATERALPETKENPMVGIAGGVAGLVIGYVSGGWLGAVMGSVIGWALATSVLGTHGDERKRVIALFIVVFFVIFFWAAYEQAGSSMTIFADKNTNRRVSGFDIPAGWFQSVNPAVILLFAPVFASLWTALGRRRREPSTPMKMVWGLFLLGVGFLFMVAGARPADAGVLVSPFWLVAAYAFHTFGELCLSPVGLSYVTKVAPIKFASLLMGVWFLANAAANKIAGTLAELTGSMSNTKFYTIFVVSSFAAAALMLVLVPPLKRLTASVKA